MIVLSLPFTILPFSLFKRCTKTKVVINEDIFELYPEYKESYFNTQDALTIKY